MVCTDCEKDKRFCKGHTTVFAAEVAEKKREEATAAAQPSQKLVDATRELLVVIEKRQQESRVASQTTFGELDTAEARLHGAITDKFTQLRKTARDLAQARDTTIEESLHTTTAHLGQLTTAVKLLASISNERDDQSVLDKCDAVNKMAAYACADSASISAAISSQLSVNLVAGVAAVEAAVSSLAPPTETPVAVTIPSLPQVTLFCVSSTVLHLDPTTAKGNSFTVGVPPTFITKSKQANGSVSCKEGFSRSAGHSRVAWRVCYGTTTSNSQQGYLLVGVHRDPTNATEASDKDPGCCGVSVTLANANNGLHVGSKFTKLGDLHVATGDVLVCYLNLRAGTFSVTHAKWSETMQLDQPGAVWYPHFLPYSAEFSLE
eukprot:TRINITY_DN637_c0_g1_i7.p1 TRINITY_DN637_c0_g1~~TRINITY_DN637_c0_g1_i7.p1  ORF type:complete len:377 (+),score=87.72 TRINITY_DN637_c0_g1_i7:523-1653(+)